jgi:hypothetical protein
MKEKKVEDEGSFPLLAPLLLFMEVVVSKKEKGK